MSLSRNQIIDWLKKIGITGKTVLDVGAGKKTKQARDYTKGEPKEYVMLDIDKEVEPDIVYDLNKEIQFGQVVTKGEYKYAEKSIDFLRDYFDIVFCLETLEHCWNPVEAVRFLYNVTKEGGTCYISVPFINPIHDAWDMLRFTDEWFEKVLSMIGFRKIEIERRVATKGLDDLINFYKVESMKFSKIRVQGGESYKLKDIGYLVTAYK